MIPILYESNEIEFASNGLGRMVDALSCTVTEERNGTFELKMQYPIDGQHYKELAEEMILYAKANDNGSQPFRIYKITRPLNNKVTVYAQHISYDLSKYTVLPFTGVSASIPQFDLMQTKIVGKCPYTFTSDRSKGNFATGTLNLRRPVTVRNFLGGMQGSFLDTYGGGEYEFDHFNVILHAKRGNDSGVFVRYGKNMTDLSSECNTQNVYTAVVPYYSQQDTVIVGDAIYSGHENEYSHPMTIPLDLTREFGNEAPTVEELNAKARTYIESNQVWMPSQNIKVSFVDLSKTEDYKDVAKLQKVGLCDTLTVVYEKLGVNITSKVTKTTYNVLTEMYDSMELGDSKTNLSQALTGSTGNVSVAQQISNMTNQLTSAINNATKKITGGLGGYVRFNTNANGEPEEILIMDTPDIETAMKVWRWNKNGLGYSDNGYNGTYGIAITNDGKIVADFINAGTMAADRIKGGYLRLGGSLGGEHADENYGNGVLEVYDSKDKKIVTMSRDGVVVEDAKITTKHEEGQGDEKILQSIKMENAKISFDYEAPNTHGGYDCGSVYPSFSEMVFYDGEFLIENTFPVINFDADYALDISAGGRKAMSIGNGGIVSPYLGKQIAGVDTITIPYTYQETFAGSVSNYPFPRIKYADYHMLIPITTGYFPIQSLSVTEHLTATECGASVTWHRHSGEQTGGDSGSSSATFLIIGFMNTVATRDFKDIEDEEIIM